MKSAMWGLVVAALLMHGEEVGAGDKDQKGKKPIPKKAVIRGSTFRPVHSKNTTKVLIQSQKDPKKSGSILKSESIPSLKRIAVQKAGVSSEFFGLSWNKSALGFLATGIVLKPFWTPETNSLGDLQFPIKDKGQEKITDFWENGGATVPVIPVPIPVIPVPTLVIPVPTPVIPVPTLVIPVPTLVIPVVPNLDSPPEGSFFGNLASTMSHNAWEAVKNNPFMFGAFASVILVGLAGLKYYRMQPKKAKVKAEEHEEVPAFPSSLVSANKTNENYEHINAEVENNPHLDVAFVDDVDANIKQDESTKLKKANFLKQENQTLVDEKWNKILNFFDKYGDQEETNPELCKIFKSLEQCNENSSKQELDGICKSLDNYEVKANIKVDLAKSNLKVDLAKLPLDVVQEEDEEDIEYENSQFKRPDKNKNNSLIELQKQNCENEGEMIKKIEMLEEGGAESSNQDDNLLDYSLDYDLLVNCDRDIELNTSNTETNIDKNTGDPKSLNVKDDKAAPLMQLELGAVQEENIKELTNVPEIVNNKDDEISINIDIVANSETTQENKNKNFEKAQMQTKKFQNSFVSQKTELNETLDFQEDIGSKNLNHENNSIDYLNNDKDFLSDFFSCNETNENKQAIGKICCKNGVARVRGKNKNADTILRESKKRKKRGVKNVSYKNEVTIGQKKESKALYEDLIAELDEENGYADRIYAYVDQHEKDTKKDAKPCESDRSQEKPLKFIEPEMNDLYDNIEKFDIINKDLVNNRAILNNILNAKESNVKLNNKHSSNKNNVENL